MTLNSEFERPKLRRSLLTLTPVFCLLLASGLLAGRLIAFDAETFLSRKHVPNHDMLAAAAFFTTNMHSLRTEGEIAWWNPVSYQGRGYAQYYQSFLSPLAPTPGHITFIVWGQTVRLLGSVGFAFPEYRQYLIYTYVVSPFLAYLSFVAFAMLIFRKRTTVILVSMAYAYSGIGLWHSAWFYFQEPFLLFFVLASWIGFLKRPSVTRLMIMLSALLVQLASANYWTVYNSWFILLVTGSYAWIYRSRTQRAWAWVLDWVRSHRRLAFLLISLTSSAVLTWGVLLASVASEQMNAHVRVQREYTKEETLQRMQDSRWFTVELFNPYLPRAIEHYKIINEIHNARYIGLVFLPLLATLPFLRWHRRERWLALSAGGVLCICLAPPFLLEAWLWWPGMKRVWHFFYFYTHYWQLLLVLLGGSVLDRLLGGRSHATIQSSRMVAMFTFAGGVLLLAGFGVFGAHVSRSEVESASRSGLLLLVFGALLYQLANGRCVCAALLVILSLSDLTRYFGEACRADRAFSAQMYVTIPDPLPREIRQRLDRPWPNADPRRGFEGGLTPALPFFYGFWPNNNFLTPKSLQQVLLRDPSFLGNAPPSVEIVSGKDSQPLENPITHWGYSDFTLQVDVPEDSWLRLNLLPDSCWSIRCDGAMVTSQAIGAATMIRIPCGSHRLELSYRPLARRLYMPACILLLVCLIVQGFIAWRFRTAMTSVRSLRVHQERFVIGERERALFEAHAVNRVPGER